jgi:hypothetical protein
MNIAPELRLLTAPSAQYRQAVAVAASPSSFSPWRGALGRPLFTALLTGTSTAIAATGRVSWALVVSGTVCWGFVALVQMGTAVALVSSANRRVSLPRALALFFLGHAAWSLWLLAAVAALLVVPVAARHPQAILIAALVPAAWTGIVIFAFCRQVLELNPRQAAIRTVLHQMVTYGVIVLYIGWAVQLWPRILWAIGR